MNTIKKIGIVLAVLTVVVTSFTVGAYASEN